MRRCAASRILRQNIARQFFFALSEIRSPIVSAVDRRSLMKWSRMQSMAMPLSDAEKLTSSWNAGPSWQKTKESMMNYVFKLFYDVNYCWMYRTRVCCRMADIQRRANNSRCTAFVVIQAVYTSARLITELVIRPIGPFLLLCNVSIFDERNYLLAYKCMSTCSSVYVV